jgi:hypothetical protein
LIPIMARPEPLLRRSFIRLRAPVAHRFFTGAK